MKPAAGAGKTTTGAASEFNRSLAASTVVCVFSMAVMSVAERCRQFPHTTAL
jgi:hypothetical protein